MAGRSIRIDNVLQASFQGHDRLFKGWAGGTSWNRLAGGCFGSAERTTSCMKGNPGQNDRPSKDPKIGTSESLVHENVTPCAKIVDRAQRRARSPGVSTYSDLSSVHEDSLDESTLICVNMTDLWVNAVRPVWLGRCGGSASANLSVCRRMPIAIGRSASWVARRFGSNIETKSSRSGANRKGRMRR